MIHYSPKWDLSTIPLDKLKAEWARRARAKRQYKLKCECGTCPTCKGREKVRTHRSNHGK